MPVHQSANFPLLVSREQSANAIAKALRLYVGRGRQFSVKELSNATGVKDRKIECAKMDADNLDHRPLTIEELLSVSRFLGAAFTNDWLKVADQGAFDLPDEDVPPGALAADNSDDNAALTRAAMDGQFTENEAPQLRVVGARMMQRGAKLVALGRAA